MSLFVTGKNEPVGAYGGLAAHYLVSCTHAPDKEDYQDHIAFVRAHSYTTDRFPLTVLDPGETFPYQSLLPKIEGDGFFIDRLNSQTILSVFRDGVVLESILYDEEPQDAEYNRLAAANDLDAPTLHEVTGYLERTHETTSFFDRDDYLAQTSNYRKYKMGAIAAGILALGMVVSTCFDSWQAYQIKKETEQVVQMSAALATKKRSLEAQLKRRGLSAEEEFRTDAVCQALKNLYPAPILAFADSDVKLRVDDPSEVNRIKGGRLVEPRVVQVTLKDLSFMAEPHTPAPAAQKP